MGREAIWPLFGLRLETPSLMLRCATEDDVCVLAAMLPPDIETDPSLPRHERLPHDEQRVIGELQQYWRNVGSWTAASWKLPFVVAAEGALIGIQALEADAFTTRRVVDTASWLVAEVRGRGHGREMRAAVLELAFAGLEHTSRCRRRGTTTTPRSACRGRSATSTTASTCTFVTTASTGYSE